MTHETDRFAVDLPHSVSINQHIVRIDGGILFLRMTSKADLSPVLIWAAPQEILDSGLAGAPVNFMTGQTPDLALK
jgi:hypothetical protein